VQGLGKRCRTSRQYLSPREMLHTSSDALLAFTIQGTGLRVQGSEFRVQGSGFRVRGSGFRVQGSGFEAWGLWFQVRGSEKKKKGEKKKKKKKKEEEEEEEEKKNKKKRTKVGDVGGAWSSGRGQTAPWRGRLRGRTRALSPEGLRAALRTTGLSGPGPGRARLGGEGLKG